MNCAATVARAIADHFRRDIHPHALADYPNVNGVVALTHHSGCAMDADGVCVLANYSEQFLLADDEREVLTRHVLETVDGRVPVIVTTSHFSSRSLI